MLDSVNYIFSLIPNWVDIAFFILILYFILTNDGFISSFLDIVGLFFASILSISLYYFPGRLLISLFSLTKGLSNALGFFIIWMVAEITFFLIVKYVLKKIPPDLYKHKANIVMGFIPAALQGIIFATFMTTLIVTLPIKGSVKKAVLDSRSGPILISISESFERRLRPVFNDAIIETLNFITIKPTSDERVDLSFRAKFEDLDDDLFSEITMFNLVNDERKKMGIKPLRLDDKLQKAAREYGREMLLGGFFSHYSAVDNSSPADRIERANIDYLVTGENLAFAPDIQIAHHGLMNSEGHRKNILSPEFGKVGVGVIDAGIYGKMFVQEFTD